jgi:alanyl-tRNA synthetase
VTVSSDEIRQAFLDFFAEKGHKVIPSSSLVPRGDPTLLLTTAGMVQIKPWFLGQEAPPSRRLVSCQKCFRTTDVESVGDSKHLTFFEMLGNFSVGDYFKREAIQWGWEFVTQRLKLSPDRLWVTVFLDDDEAFGIWREIGVSESRILRFGRKENFWGPAGETGPCGPCSEIHYDFGPGVGCGRPDCKPNCDCARFSEIWNLVFAQFNQDKTGTCVPLPRPNIDTGMGLERMAAVMQNKSTVYETDVFAELVGHVVSKAGRKFGGDESLDRAIRIVAEHSRGISFLIADGVQPSNDGRGYVLRRLLRRAAVFGRRLGLDGPFLTEVCDLVIKRMGRVYPELVKNRAQITQIVRAEEGRFASTLGSGLNMLEKLMDHAAAEKKTVLSGNEVFTLYDTYGFPRELTIEIARERGLSVDVDGFDSEMERQRERARAAHKFQVVAGTAVSGKITEFVGYEETESTTTVVSIVVDGKPTDLASQGQKVEIMLERSPFYAEKGGQVGDTGQIVAQGGTVEVTDTVANSIHLGSVTSGTVRVGDVVHAAVDEERRRDIARNHTATHLLQAALRQVLGEQVHQRGSLVTPDRFRFDFPQLAPVMPEVLLDIQAIVNSNVRRDLHLATKVMSYKQAVAEGAMAVFEEKYGDTVRVVQIGKPAVSSELCGGTHLNSTGEIGAFLIVSESSIGTGLRRIEAVTGRGADKYVSEQLSRLQSVAAELDSSTEEVGDRVKAIMAELSSERKRTSQLESDLARRAADSLSREISRVNGVAVVSAKVPGIGVAALRELGDTLRMRLGSAVIVLATVFNDRPSFIAMVSPDLVTKGYNAGDIVKQVAAITGGSGGGKPAMAQAGGKDKDKLDEALGAVRGLVERVGQVG